MAQDRTSPTTVSTELSDQPSNQSTNTNNDSTTKKKTKDGFAPGIRIKVATRRLFDKLLTDANKKDLGRTIKTDDLMHLALSLVRPEHIAELQKRSMTEDHWYERALRVFTRRNGKATADDFKRLVYSGQVRIRFGEDDEHLVEDLRDNKAAG